MMYRTPEAAEDARTKFTRRNYTLGLDLGQSIDPTAVAVIERVRVPQITAWVPVREPHVYATTYGLRHLERLPLGTTYPDIITHVQTMLATAPLAGNCRLVIDKTGVGRPVFDMFTTAKLRPRGMTITAGDGWSIDPDHGDSVRVAKLLLVSRLEASLHSGALKISKDLKELPALISELQDFTSNRTASGYTQFNARQGKHDDMILAVAIALWHTTVMDSRQVIVQDLLYS
jgi:hypothetical protein